MYNWHLVVLDILIIRNHVTNTCIICMRKVLYDWVNSASVLVRFLIKSSVELARGRGRGVIDDVDDDGKPCCVLETFDNNARGSVVG
nr:hypothetical protein [Tanacetum cinerariifolium]